jgi:hypothetical protein
MSSKQDRQGSRTTAELERKYNFEKRFDDAMDAADKASRKVDDFDKRMDQTEVFNRLTNNGKAQGLYRDEEGNLFINASYLATGILASKDGHSFYLDLDKGILKGQFKEFSISGKTVDQIAEEKAKTAQKYADKVAKRAVSNQSQTDVFNKLTNNGSAEGIFYQNGQLFINASYLVAGILQTLDASTFSLDLTNNKLKIMGKAVSWKENSDGTFTLVGE